jgi:hypothetical protein
MYCKDKIVYQIYAILFLAIQDPSQTNRKLETCREKNRRAVCAQTDTNLQFEEEITDKL